jgi:hypothetical protein
MNSWNTAVVSPFALSSSQRFPVGVAASSASPPNSL